MAFVAFTYEILLFDVTFLENNRFDVPVYSPKTFFARKERGWTKIVDRFIFTAVGHDGLDIYKVDSVMYQSL